MRKLLIMLTSAMAVAIAALAGIAGASTSTQGADIYGVGGGKTDFGMTTFNMSAHSTGTRDFGTIGVTEFVGTTSEASYTIDVDCVHITGQTGVISGLVKKLSPATSIEPTLGERVDVLIGDGGEPSPQSAPVDAFYPNHPAVTTDSTQCKNLALAFPLQNVTQGNVVIKNG